MSHEPTDFEIVSSALTGWDTHGPEEVAPARAALERIRIDIAELKAALREANEETKLFHGHAGRYAKLLR